MPNDTTGTVTSAAALHAFAAQVARLDSWEDICRRRWLDENGEEGTGMSEEEHLASQQMDLDNLTGDHDTLEALIEQARDLVAHPLHVTVLVIENDDDAEDVDEWICLNRAAAESMIEVAFRERFVDHVFMEGDAALDEEAFRAKWKENHTIRIETRTLHDVAAPAPKPGEEAKA